MDLPDYTKYLGYQVRIIHMCLTVSDNNKIALRNITVIGTCIEAGTYSIGLKNILVYDEESLKYRYEYYSVMMSMMISIEMYDFLTPEEAYEGITR